MKTFYLITHPNVVVSRDVPVPRWPLSELVKQRMRAGLRQPWISEVTSVYCSTEQKAIDGAAILAGHLSLGFEQVEALGENDRSATGFLPPDEFERVADQFFGTPEDSIRDWERAVDAQARMVRAVQEMERASSQPPPFPPRSARLSGAEQPTQCRAPGTWAVSPAGQV